MSKIRLYGATSGYVDLAAPAVADDATLTLPTGAAAIASEAYVTSALSGITSLRFETGYDTWTVYGSGTEVRNKTFSSAFSSTPIVWAMWDNEVYEVNLSNITTTGFTFSAPWYSGSPTGGWVSWFALGAS
jgi:hypothetical protein